MKKFLLLLIGLMFLVSSCYPVKNSVGTQGNRSEESQRLIPFLAYYHEPDNKVAAKLAYWDLNHNKVNFTDKLVYIAEDLNFVEPVIWDGNSRLVLRKTSYPADEFKEKTEFIKDYTMNTVYGRNIEAKRNLDDNPDPVQQKVKDYSLYLHNNHGIIERKAVFLLKTKDDKGNDVVIGEEDYPSYVDYNKETGEITFIFKYFFETHTSIYVAKCNAANINKIHWDEIRLTKGIKTGGNYTPYPNNSVLIGSKYYIQSFLSLAEIDLNKKESKVLDHMAKECRSIVKEGSFVPEFPKDILPIGVYEDVLILSLPVSTDTGIEYLLCAFQNNEFQGAIHLKIDDTWNVIDSNKKNVSEISVKDKKLFKRFNAAFLYFPFLGNVM
ncbi:hypothetical protein [Thermotalea metallivorans]|uniref:Lipoprotein n=1 Tax=Thermotalea metallivorans TaxID=520762 RepID=A0A140L2V7_9FIRM|nr:hypothetical protein [Thermotalea metallivorans]KXG74882.1 hypothetical protein AN619_20520 [Thermotalea metallivorans]